ncbi:c-type cytochrome [Ichthyobacterium seriolicida]|uniref:Cytochrome C n=1 Tax=Ichthyobacterium seriolicida TaxID=242600 RepID=A0A1J1E9R0_9FLAO|nr:c-type cytochrome [Ichthyobacterium seriolicida]BAV94264.1 cytochrome C [Ichthyobacterium seriolicida]
MKKETLSIMRKCCLVIIFLFSIAYNSYSQDKKAGKALFNSLCASCHNLDKKTIGPPLRGISQKRSKEWLHSWIIDNVKLRESGDVDAIAIFEEYNGSLMSPFPQLSDADVDNILAHLNTPKEDKNNVATSSGEKNTGGGGSDKGISTEVFLSVIVAIMLLFTAMLFKSKNAIKAAKGEQTFSFFGSVKNIITKFLKNKRLLTVFIIIIIFSFLRLGWNWLMQVGVNTGYEPIQPIAFSHKIHAGDNKIDCMYCHSSVKYSKTAGIPSVNVCMNCHFYIQEGTNTGTKEIAKIYNAIGFDPETSSYIENYEQKPIKWIKVHDLQDFVYFNHSQHVKVGGIACETCHGPVKEMDDMRQHSDLTMGWCVNCHRETQVKMEGNPYYEDIHNQMKEKHKGSKITVDKIGGLECGKCHY